MKGDFRLRSIPAGSYTLRIGSRGFRERILTGIEVRSGEFKEVGNVSLDLAGCEAPGVMCDTFGLEESLEIGTSRAYLTLKPGETADLDKTAVNPQSGGDVRLSYEAGSWKLAPLNGASMSTDCGAAAFRNEFIRLDGMGPGSEFCVRTDERHFSHVFVPDEILPDTTSVRLWYVTRK